MKNYMFQINQFKVSWFVLFLILTSVFMWSGCSVIGWVIGSKTKKTNISEMNVSGWEIEKIKMDDQIKVLLINSDSIVGKYKGNYIIPFEEYKEFYNQSISLLNEPDDMPFYGELIKASIKSPVMYTNESSISLPFGGFDLKHIYLMDGINIKKIMLSSISSLIDSKGKSMDIGKIIQLVKNGNIPSISWIQVETVDYKTTKINPTDISTIKIKKGDKNYAMTGFLIGLGVDIVAVAVAASVFKDGIGFQNTNTQPIEFGSCPFVYSFDGTEYKLDSETFGGAIFKSAQRTDLDNLDYLQDYQNSYKLKLTNELDETQYVDELKVLIVDHSPGTLIKPSFDGNLHLLKTLESPFSATNMDGTNIIDLVKSKDNKVWSSNPFSRNPEIKSEGRDAIHVEFIKPKNADQVKLLLNIQNTFWASSLQKNLLSMHGNKLQDWYKQMNDSKEARTVFTQAMIREGMLLVKVWNGAEWQTMDFVWEVGPFIPKDQVVKLDLKDISENVLRIKLESTVGFWMVNSIEADFSNDTEFSIVEIAPENAIDQSGKNVKELLLNTDGIYHVMPYTTDWVELSFKTIPKIKNSIRSFILKSNGYYNIHTVEKGEPHSALLNKLVSEPGAYGQFTLQELNQLLVGINY